MTTTPRPPGAPRAALAPGFGEALHEAVGLAALSPSSHNCQPWAIAWLTSSEARRTAVRFLREGEDGPDRGRGGDMDTSRDRRVEFLVLALDRERQLGSLPAHAVEMLLSCGLYWQVLLSSLDALGWGLDGVRSSGGAAARHGDRDGRDGFTEGLRAALGVAWPPDWSPLCVVRLRRGRPSGGMAELRRAVRARGTNRGPYLPGAVDPLVLDGLLAPSTGMAGSADVAVRHLSAEAERSDFAEFVARHGGRDFSHPHAWRETHSFLRWSREEAEERGDGFTLAQLFGPLSAPRRLAMRVALAPATMRVLRRAGYHRLLARQLAAVVRPSPVVVAMSFAHGSPTVGDAVRAGARLADYWLRTTGAGLALHPVSVVIQHDDLRTRLEDRLGLPGRAFFISRLGRPAMELPRAPRRSPSKALRTV